jgi:hypothetical protein
MDYSVPVRIVHRTGYSGGDVHRFVNRELPLAVQTLAQRFALHIRHHIEEETVGFPGIEEGEQRWMLQVGGKLDLAEDTLRAYYRSEVGFEDLEGDVPVVFDIAREVNGRHPAGADFAFDAIAAFEGCGELLCY